jgi:hypothetical protein
MPQVGHKWLFVIVVAATSRYTVPDAVPLQQVMAYRVTACHAGQWEDRIKHLEQELKPCMEGIRKLEAVTAAAAAAALSKMIIYINSLIQIVPNLEAYDIFHVI